MSPDPRNASFEEVAAAFPHGTVVQYRPHIGHDPWFLGMVALSDPRKVGGTWCVRLYRMEHGYPKAGVSAVAIDALTVLARPEDFACFAESSS